MLRIIIISIFSLFLLFSGCDKKEEQGYKQQDESISDTLSVDTTKFEEEDWQ
jgi:hypothetical protein